MHPHLIDHKQAINFITAGKALFTLRSEKTGNCFTYNVVAPSEQSKENPNVLFVKVLTGSNNEGDYTYIGYVKKVNGNWCFVYGTKSKVGANALSVVAFNYVFNHLALHKQITGLEIWHEGKCCRCGRTLTNPESIINGIGPECSSIKQIFNQKNLLHGSL